MTADKIYLVGFMAAGKTTVARALGGNADEGGMQDKLTTTASE